MFVRITTLWQIFEYGLKIASRHHITIYRYELALESAIDNCDFSKSLKDCWLSSLVVFQHYEIFVRLSRWPFWIRLLVSLISILGWEKNVHRLSMTNLCPAMSTIRNCVQHGSNWIMKICRFLLKRINFHSYLALFLWKRRIFPIYLVIPFIKNLCYFA